MAADQHRSDAWAGMGAGWAITSTMVAGIGVWAGLGYVADRLLGSTPVLFVIGMMVGAAAGIYLVWLRHGRGDSGATGA
jgi:F0F1-type ATP synthase assembly protein I